MCETTVSDGAIGNKMELVEMYAAERKCWGLQNHENYTSSHVWGTVTQEKNADEYKVGSSRIPYSPLQM